MTHKRQDGRTLDGTIRILSGAAEVSAQASIHFVDGYCREAVFLEPGEDFAGAVTSVRFLGAGAERRVEVFRQGALESYTQFALSGPTKGHYRLAEGALTFTIVTHRLDVLQESGELQAVIDAVINFDAQTESHVRTRILLTWSEER